MRFLSNADGLKAATSTIGSRPKRSCAPPRWPTWALQRLRHKAVLKPPAAVQHGPKSEVNMPEKRVIERARRDARKGKSASTQAGEFVREEMRHIRQGKHGARSTKQAIAIGLSEARRAGVKLAPPPKGRVSEKTRRSAASAYRKGQRGERISPKRSRAIRRALKREGRSAASRKALSRQAKASARRRGARARSASTHKAAMTRSQRLRRINRARR
jgi:hypothetical protein